MNLWQRWLRRPQTVWLRKAFFQVHLWTGIALGLYILAISISGSAVVFRNEIYRAADQGPILVEPAGELLSDDQLKAAAVQIYPDYTVSFLWKGKEVNQATEVWMDRDGERNQRLFNPYTGADLGPSVPYGIQIAAWFISLHTDLLAGDTGRLVNGFAAILCTLLCISGAVVWWPGKDKWVRALWVNPKSGWKRINWDLHSAVGFWTFGLVFMWMISGVYLVWPLPFQKAINHFSPLIQYALPEEDPEPAARYQPAPGFAAANGILAQVTPGFSDEGKAFGKGGGKNGVKGKGKGRRQPIRRSAGDNFIRWIYYLHFGNFAGNKTKALWVVLGLLPVLLLITGAIMWWNRVLSRTARKLKREGQIPTAA